MAENDEEYTIIEEPCGLLSRMDPEQLKELHSKACYILTMAIYAMRIYNTLKDSYNLDSNSKCSYLANKDFYHNDCKKSLEEELEDDYDGSIPLRIKKPIKNLKQLKLDTYEYEPKENDSKEIIDITEWESKSN